MISTQELKAWKDLVISTGKNAQEQAKHWATNEGMFSYYLNLIQTSQAQRALLDRLIMQSEENDKKGE